MAHEGEAKRQGQQPVEVFYSYSHKDEDLRVELENHLSILRRQGAITGWHFRKIGVGTEWQGDINSRLARAKVILLLISADFLASDYCYDNELMLAMVKHQSGEARVIPIVLRSVDWAGAPFGKLQALPKDAKPVTSWSNRDEAFTDIARGIRKAVEELTPFPPSLQADSLATPLLAPTPVQPSIFSRYADPSVRNQVPKTGTLFVWTAVLNAPSYELQVSSDLTFADLSKTVVDKTSANKLGNQLAYVSEVALNPASVYFWRVRANSGTADSNWSQVAAFATIGGGVTVSVEDSTKSIAGAFDILLVFDRSSLNRKAYVPGAPTGANTLQNIMPGTPVWIRAKRAIIWTRGPNSVALVPGWNLVLVP